MFINVYLRSFHSFTLLISLAAPSHKENNSNSPNRRRLITVRDAFLATSVILRDIALPPDVPRLVFIRKVIMKNKAANVWMFHGISSQMNYDSILGMEPSTCHFQLLPMGGRMPFTLPLLRSPDTRSIFTHFPLRFSLPLVLLQIGQNQLHIVLCLMEKRGLLLSRLTGDSLSLRVVIKLHCTRVRNGYGRDKHVIGEA